jgi:hypothetical protein
MDKIINQFKRVIVNEYFLLSVVLILGFVVRLYKIDNPIADWHSWRQADTASVSRTYVEAGINLLYPQYQDISSIQTGIPNPKGYRFVEFPVYNAAHAILAQSFPNLSLEVWGRFFSTLCALVSAFFLFLIGKRFISRWGGLLSAAFFLLIPYNIYFTRVILPEPLGVTFVLISIWFFSLFIDTDRLFYLSLSGIFFALALLIKPFIIFYLLPLGYLAIKKYGAARTIFQNAQVLIRALTFLAIVLIPFFLWRTWVNQYPAGIPFFEWAFNGDHIRFRPSFFRWIFGERLGHLILGDWGLIPFAFGLLAPATSLFIPTGLLGMLLYVVVVATANVRHDYYQIIIIPAVALALAQGTLYLWRGEKFNQLLSRGVLVLSLLVMFIMGALQVKEFYKINHPEIIAAGQALDAIAPKDALVIAPYNGDTAFLYQTGRWGWPAVDSSIPEIIEKGASYYTSVNFSDPDTKFVMQTYKVVAKTDKYMIADLREEIK